MGVKHERWNSVPFNIGRKAVSELRLAAEQSTNFELLLDDNVGPLKHLRQKFE
jgi:hypothetical protein